jgi:hypothetical protein
VTPTFTPAPRLDQGGGYVIHNPFVPARGQVAIFAFTAPGPYQIRIYTIKGREVRVLENLAQWDGRDQDGRLCEGGLYLYRIEANGQRVNGTLVLIED